ncbi:MAG: hypothetical protein L3J91_05100, partial [Thermoplasmata archaeon]|nr:hypothetical protein [Thermoplasmata archaeon]
VLSVVHPACGRREAGPPFGRRRDRRRALHCRGSTRFMGLILFSRVSPLAGGRASPPVEFPVEVL